MSHDNFLSVFAEMKGETGMERVDHMDPSKGIAFGHSHTSKDLS
jgi:hypothetical protein